MYFKTNSYKETEEIAYKLGSNIKPNTVIAMYGGLGLGKTCFVRGLAKGMGLNSEVSSPTFSLVNEYRGKYTLYHFDMYRISNWDDLYSTGFFDYLDTDAVIVIEWSENIENALPDDSIKVYFEKGNKDNERIITIDGWQC